MPIPYVPGCAQKAIWIPWQYRTRTHRKKRARKSCPGELVHVDGSFHRWFGPHYGCFCLIAMVDDATGELYARFVAQEYAESVVLLLGGWIEGHGIPYALYFDQ